jgi:hypothetical protein
MVTRMAVLEQGLGIVVAGPGQLRPVASLVAKDEGILKVHHRLVEPTLYC